MKTIQPEVLQNFITAIFQAAGAPEAHAQLVANSLVAANLAGHDSHGVIRTVQYLSAIQNDELDPTAVPKVASQVGVVTMLDAQRAFGQVAAQRAMQIAIEKAKEYAMASVGLFNCGHVGRLGEWVQMAADAQMIGMGFCNGGSPGGLVTPHGGAARRLGTNPLAAAIPRAEDAPVVVDFATSVVAEGKVRVARNSGKALPAGRILDANGAPSTDPNDLYAGGMLLPAAEHKGYCLALLMDYLGGILTGAGCASLPNFRRGNGVLFMVLSIEAFRPLDAFLSDAAALSDVMRATPPAAGYDEVLTPGDPEQRTAQQRRAHGIPLDDTTWSQLVEVATAHDVAAPA